MGKNEILDKLLDFFYASSYFISGSSEDIIQYCKTHGISDTEFSQAVEGRLVPIMYHIGFINHCIYLLGHIRMVFPVTWATIKKGLSANLLFNQRLSLFGRASELCSYWEKDLKSPEKMEEFIIDYLTSQPITLTEFLKECSPVNNNHSLAYSKYLKADSIMAYKCKQRLLSEDFISYVVQYVKNYKLNSDYFLKIIDKCLSNKLMFDDFFIENIIKIIESGLFWNKENIELKKNIINLLVFHRHSTIENYLRKQLSFSIYLECLKKNKNILLIEAMKSFLSMHKENKDEALKSIIRYLHFLSEEELYVFISQLMDIQNIEVLQAFYQLQELGIHGEAIYREYSPFIAKILIFQMNNEGISNVELKKKIVTQKSFDSVAEFLKATLYLKLEQNRYKLPDIAQFQIPPNYKFLRIQGRTLLFQHEKEPKIYAIKILKTGENLQEFSRQKITVDFLNKYKEMLGLKSQYPQAVVVGYLEGLNKFIQQLKIQGSITQEEYEELNNKINITDCKNQYVYSYIAHPNYFVYINSPDISITQAYQGMQSALHDLLLFIDMGMLYDQLIDLFHTRENGRGDKGRYLSLVDLLRYDDTITEKPRGLGRLSGWKNSQWPNIRLTGLADEGDWKKLESFQEASEENPFVEIIQNNPQHADKAIKANFIAEALLCMMLCLGMRACALQDRNSATSSENIWQETANCLIQLHVDALQYLCPPTSFEQTREIFLSLIDKDRYAKQMKYWMTDENIDYSLKGQVKADIYETGADVYIVSERIERGTLTEHGWCVDSALGPDLGTFNGPFPIQEAAKGFYALVTLGFFSRALLQKQKIKENSITENHSGSSVNGYAFWQNSSTSEESSESILTKGQVYQF